MVGTPAARLKKARENAGYTSATAAAKAMGIAAPTYLAHENGTTGFPHNAARYATFFKVTTDWLMLGKGTAGARKRVPVVSYIGAGAEVFPIDDHAQGRGLELVDPPTGQAGEYVAAKIRGDSMFPMEDGWLVFWSRDQAGVPDECIGKLSVCQVKNGPMLLKYLQRGTRSGLYTLTSWNAPARPDVQLEWASRVIGIRPG